MDDLSPLQDVLHAIDYLSRAPLVAVRELEESAARMLCATCKRPFRMRKCQRPWRHSYGNSVACPGMDQAMVPGKVPTELQDKAQILGQCARVAGKWRDSVLASEASGVGGFVYADINPAGVPPSGPTSIGWSLKRVVMIVQQVLAGSDRRMYHIWRRSLSLYAASAACEPFENRVSALIALKQGRTVSAHPGPNTTVSQGEDRVLAVV